MIQKIKNDLKNAGFKSFEIDNIISKNSFENIEERKVDISFNVIKQTATATEPESFLIFEGIMSKKVKIETLKKPLYIESFDFYIYLNPSGFCLYVRDKLVISGYLEYVTKKYIPLLGEINIKDVVGIDKTPDYIQGMVEKRFFVSFLYASILSPTNPIMYLLKGYFDISNKINNEKNQIKSTAFLDALRNCKKTETSEDEDIISDKIIVNKINPLMDDIINRKPIPDEVLVYLKKVLDKLKTDKCKTCPAFIEDIKSTNLLKLPSSCSTIGFKKRICKT